MPGQDVQLRLGPYTIDTGTRQLRRGSEVVHLSGKAFRLLEALLEARPQAVPKAVLRERLWPATFVHEANLSNLVAEVRAALGDDARQPRTVRTVHGYGYAFCGEVSLDEPPRVHAYRLVLDSGTIVLGDGEHVLGRGRGAAVVLRSRMVSRRHALLRASGGQATLEDEGSRNGTFVGGRRLSGPVTLVDGDEIRLGHVTLRFYAGPVTDATSATDGP
jgi:DNA-binding winged helix-turn-helix (wHTH) protein